MSNYQAFNQLTTMRKSIGLLSILFLVLISCDKPSGSDVEPIQEEVPEASSEAFLAFYNSSVDDISITINSSTNKVDLSKTRLSKYFSLGMGDHEVVISKAETGERLLSKEITLNGGQYYSSFLFKNQNGDYDLILNNEYDETTKAQGSIRSGLEFAVVNLSKNIPHPSVSIVNSFTYMTANCGANVEHCTVLCHDLKDTWVENLKFGTSQNIQNAPLSITTNYLQFLTGENGNIEIPVVGFKTSTRSLTIDPNGSGNLQTIERPHNLTAVLDTDIIHLLVIQDDPDPENEEGVWAHFFKLSDNPVSPVVFNSGSSN